MLAREIEQPLPVRLQLSKVTLPYLKAQRYQT